MIESPLALAATIAAITALAFWLESRFSWAEKIGASLLVIALGAALSNLQLVPVSSPVYGAIGGPVTSLAIVWLLLAVDLRDLKLAGPRMVGAFLLAAFATAMGTLVATLLFAGAVGEETWKLAGAMTGTYSGGSLNFVSVGRALEMSEALFAAATAADNVMTALWMGATLLLPLWLKGFYPAAPAPLEPSTASRDEEAEAQEHALLRPTPMAARDLAFLAAAGGGLLLATEAVARLTPAIPSVLWLTTLSLAAGQLPAVRRLRGAMHLGSFALHLFFAVIGIGSRISEILTVGMEVFYFTATVVLVHGLLTYGLARMVRLDVETTSVASQAAVGGPSTALALAVSRGWPHLLLPGVAVGLLGYALGTYCGLGAAWVARLWLGG